MTQQTTILDSPFVIATDKPLVAIVGSATGSRRGYIQLATAKVTTSYADLPDNLFLAAKSWASLCEQLGAERIYWLTFSEVVRHLHIHLYPRWPEDNLRGPALFEARQQPEQPPWLADDLKALDTWAAQWQVHLMDVPKR